MNKKHVIELIGCDDETLIVMDLNNEQKKFLAHLSMLSSEKSRYSCQPVLKIREYDPEGEDYLEENDDE